MTQKWVGSDDKDPTLGDRELNWEKIKISVNVHSTRDPPYGDRGIHPWNTPVHSTVDRCPFDLRLNQISTTRASGESIIGGEAGILGPFH